MAENKRAMREAAIKRLNGVLKNPPLGSLCSEDIVSVLVGDGWSDTTFEDDVKTIIELLTDDEPSHDINWLNNVPQDSDGVLWVNGGKFGGDTITAPLTLDNTIRPTTTQAVTQRENDLIELLKDAARDYVRIQTYYKGLLGEYDHICENNYMSLPVDIDDVPIHIGDVMKNTYGPEHFTVLAIGNDGCEDVLFCEDDDLNYQCYSAMACVHYREPTIQDIVEELVSEAYSNGWADGSDDTFLCDTAELVREYTERLKSL